MSLLIQIPVFLQAQHYYFSPASIKSLPHHDAMYKSGNSSKKLTSLLELNYDQPAGKYDTAQRTLFEYNKLDSIGKERVQNYNQGIFQDSALVSLSYDEKGHQTVWLYQRVFADNGSIVNSEKDSSAYDSHGNLVYSDKAYWNGSQWTTFYGVQTAYTYDSKGNMTGQELQLLNPGSSWAKQYKANYKLDANGNIIAAHEFLADINGIYATDDSLIDMKLYNNDVNRPIQETYVQDSAGKWIIRTRYTAAYNTAGQVFRAREEFLNGRNWNVDETWTWRYDAHGMNTYYADSVMSAGQMQLYQANQADFTYDTDGDLITAEMLSYDVVNNTWNKEKKLIYNYEEQTGLKQWATDKDAISIYPNPAQQEIHISTSQLAGNATYTMLDMAGRIVYSISEQCSENEVVVPLGELKSGVYTLLVRNNTNWYSRLVVKE